MLTMYCIVSYNQEVLVILHFEIIFSILITGKAMIYANYCLGILFPFLSILWNLSPVWDVSSCFI